MTIGRTRGYSSVFNSVSRATRSCGSLPLFIRYSNSPSRSGNLLVITYVASFVIAPDYKQVLTRRGIPPRRIIMRTAVADIYPFDDAIAQWTAALDDPPAHDRQVAITPANDNSNVCNGLSQSAPQRTQQKSQSPSDPLSSIREHRCVTFRLSGGRAAQLGVPPCI
jgi:hypothetical protein